MKVSKVIFRWTISFQGCSSFCSLRFLQCPLGFRKKSVIIWRRFDGSWCRFLLVLKREYGIEELWPDIGHIASWPLLEWLWSESSKPHYAHEVKYTIHGYYGSSKTTSFSQYWRMFFSSTRVEVSPTLLLQENSNIPLEHTSDPNHQLFMKEIVPYWYFSGTWGMF